MNTEWTLINPQGVVGVEPVELAPCIETLERKTVLLRWNGKPNGEIFLNRIAELLSEKVPTAKVIKLYEEDPLTAQSGRRVEIAAAEMSRLATEYHPDIVIAAQAD